jgi:hypothetical protein
LLGLIGIGLGSTVLPPIATLIRKFLLLVSVSVQHALPLPFGFVAVVPVVIVLPLPLPQAAGATEAGSNIALGMVLVVEGLDHGGKPGVVLPKVQKQEHPKDYY